MQPDPVELQRIRTGLGRELRVAIEAARNFADGLEDTLPGIERAAADADTVAALAELAETLATTAKSCAGLGQQLQEGAEVLRSLVPTAAKEQPDA